MKKSIKQQNWFKYRSGVTLIELMVTLLIATLVIAGIGVAMVDSIKSFPLMNERTQGDVVTDAYVARATFDRICRQASVTNPVDGYFSTSEITVYYYSNPSAPMLDSSAKFILENNTLNVYYGNGAGGNFGSAVPLASNVQSVRFEVQGSSILMALAIDNTNDTNARQKMKMTVTSAAMRHNDWP
jgi:hypothetical protein